MDDPFQFFEEDDMIFHYILSKLYDDFNASKTNDVEDLVECFGEGVPDYVYRLQEKKFIDFVKTTVGNHTHHFLDINDKGIEAFKTIYNPQIVNQNVEMAAHEVLEEEEEKIENKRHRERTFFWTKIGIILSGVFSITAVVISILAYLK